MKKFILLTLLSAAAHADMYYECTKQSETEPVNITSSAPQRIDLDVTDSYLLHFNNKKVKFKVLNDKDFYKPVFQTERFNLGELEVATYKFDGQLCDSIQSGTLIRTAQIGAPDVIETAEYTCVCGED